jgi:hypothetical protein
VKGAIVISAGFKELGPEGVELERQVLVEARKGGIRIIGPNCLGLMSPPSGVNATFAAGMARPGNVGFISQSGALCTAVLDWSFREMVGFSAFVSIGSMVDVGWGDLIDYLGQDPLTRSILIYMESVGDARSFLSAAREVALRKPIIVIKAGRTAAGGKAAASHTGSLTGSNDVLDAAFRRTGILRVNNISELFYLAEVLAKQPRPKGNKLSILTNAGGPAVLATDALISSGGQLAELSHRYSRRRRRGKIRQVAGDRRQGPQQRWAPGGSDSPGDDGCDPDRRVAERLREAGRQARAGKLDGRTGNIGRRANTQRRRHPDVSVSGHRGPRLPVHVVLHIQPSRALRNPDPAGGRRRGRFGSRQGAEDH